MTLMRTTQVNPAEEPFAMLSGITQTLKNKKNPFQAHHQQPQFQVQAQTQTHPFIHPCLSEGSSISTSLLVMLVAGDAGLKQTNKHFTYQVSRDYIYIEKILLFMLHISITPINLLPHGNRCAVSMCLPATTFPQSSLHNGLGFHVSMFDHNLVRFL